MTAFTLRRVDATDTAMWARIVAMDADCFPTGMAPALSDNAGAWWVATTDDGQDAGYCGVKKSSSGRNYGYLCRAGVLSKFRGRGLQKQLIRVRLAFAKRQGWSHVVTDTHDNPASANSLISCGFRLYEPEAPWSFEAALYWKKNLA